MFQTRVALLALAACAVTISSAAAAAVDVTTAPGGETREELTTKDMELLTAALSDDAKYEPQVTERLCFTTVLPTVVHQVVEGWKYTFTVNGCVVSNAKEQGGWCPKDIVKTCTQKAYDVTILSQPWKQKPIQVIKIQSVGSPFTLAPTVMPTTPPPACPDKN